MKRYAVAALALAGCLLLGGCGARRQGTAVVFAPAESAASMPAVPPAAAPAATPAPASAASAQTGAAAGEGVDVDLTQLSSTLVYGEVYQMLLDPDSYVGKTVRMQGQFAVYDGNPDDPNAQPYYFAVVVQDATACCQQGIEFVWDGHAYPQDYPPEGSEITVTGVFQTYTEGQQLYFHLVSSQAALE